MLSTEQSMKEYNLDTITCPIHSFETFGAVDGPGIRFVILTQGCNLKCKYCQNYKKIQGQILKTGIYYIFDINEIGG